MKRMRYIVGGTLVLGIAAGVWLSDFLKGLGTGSGVGIGTDGLSGVQTSVSSGTPDLGVSSDMLASHQTTSTTNATPTPDPATAQVPATLRVIVRDRNYFLVNNEEETPVQLPALVDLAKKATGDEDGIRVRVYRADSARVTTVMALDDALKSAKIPDSAVYTSPDALD